MRVSSIWTVQLPSRSRACRCPCSCELLCAANRSSSGKSREGAGSRPRSQLRRSPCPHELPASPPPHFRSREAGLHRAGCPPSRPRSLRHDYRPQTLLDVRKQPRNCYAAQGATAGGIGTACGTPRHAATCASRASRRGAHGVRARLRGSVFPPLRQTGLVSRGVWSLEFVK